MVSCSGIGALATLPDLERQHSEDEFELGWLPTDILEGVMQRVGGKAKMEVEVVNQRFSVIARRLAWRHCHTIKVDLWFPCMAPHRIPIGSYNIEAVDTAAATRFFLGRSVIHNVEFNVDLDKGRIAHRELRKEHCRSILAALLSSEMVALRSLILHQPPAQLFGGNEQLAALICRHSSTLQEVGLLFHNGEPATDVSSALTACPSLHKLTAFVYNRYKSGDSWRWPLGRLIHRLQLRSLTMSGRGLKWPVDPVALTTVLPTAPMLTELHVKGFMMAFTEEFGWSALANLRLFEADRRSVRLSYHSTQEEVNRVFSAVLPSLEVLSLTYESSCRVYWTLLTKLVTAFLSRAGDHSLAVELPVFGGGCQAWRRPLSEWRAVFPKLSIEGFGAETGAQVEGGGAACARAAPPKEFKHAAVSQVVVLGRPNETRRITIALWETIP